MIHRLTITLMHMHELFKQLFLRWSWIIQQTPWFPTPFTPQLRLLGRPKLIPDPDTLVVPSTAFHETSSYSTFLDNQTSSRSQQFYDPCVTFPFSQFKTTHPSKHTRFSSIKLYLTCATFNLDENPVPVISYYRHFFLYYYHVRCHHCSIASSICIHHITYITKLIYLS